MQGLVLGLANGTTCLAYCAPVLIPFFLGEGKRTRQNLSLLGRFLGGRLAGYLLFAVLAWVVGRWMVPKALYRGMIFGLIYMMLAVMLLVYGLIKVPSPCVGSVKGVSSGLGRWHSMLPVTLGFLTGLNLCPPFLRWFNSPGESAVASPAGDHRGPVRADRKSPHRIDRPRRAAELPQRSRVRVNQASEGRYFSRSSRMASYWERILNGYRP
jgi:hypothetical protein